MFVQNAQRGKDVVEMLRQAGVKAQLLCQVWVGDVLKE